MSSIITKELTQSLQDKWNEVVIESFKTHETLTGKALLSAMMSHVFFWRKLGIPEAGKIAVCIPSGMKWAELFLSGFFSEYVVVALPGDIDSAIVAAQHSDCNALYIQPSDLDLICVSNFAFLDYIISADDNNVLWSSKQIKEHHTSVDLNRTNEFVDDRHSPDDLALIIYTSGTSTRTKGVMLSYKNISTCVHANYSRFPYQKYESYLSILPLNHIFGLMYDLLLPLCKGMHLFLLDYPPIPEFIIPALRSIRPIMLFSVPLVIYKLMEEIKSQDNWEVLSSCKMITCGGAGVQPAFSEWMIMDRKLPFNIGYGMSECSPAICVPDINNYEINSCGRPVDSLEVSIDSEDPMRIPGEILVKGDSVFIGYYKDDCLTQKLFSTDGWFRTGDLGILSQKGNVFLCGRKDSQLSSNSGKNYFLDDVENILLESRYIKDAIIIPFEGHLKALVVPYDSISEEPIRAYIADINSRFVQGIYISDIQFIDKIERTEKGTVKRSVYQ